MKITWQIPSDREWTEEDFDKYWTEERDLFLVQNVMRPGYHLSNLEIVDGVEVWTDIKYLTNREVIAALSVGITGWDDLVRVRVPAICVKVGG